MAHDSTIRLARQPRPLSFALGQLWHDNPNYRNGTWSKHRAGLETRVGEILRSLPALMARRHQWSGHPVYQAFLRELLDSMPEEWMRPAGGSRWHLPHDSMTAARRFLARVARFRLWLARMTARFAPRHIMAISKARAKASETSRQEHAESLKAMLRRWAQDQGVPWGAESP